MSEEHVHELKQIERTWINEENILGRLIRARGLVKGCECGEDYELIKMLEFDLRYAGKI